MAAEINQLKSTVITLKEDNDRVLTLLDAKQNAWIEVEAKKRSNISPSKSTTAPVKNRFEALSVEDQDQSQVLPADNPTIHEKIDTQAQLNAYHSKQKEKFAKSKNGSAKETKKTADYEDHKAKLIRINHEAAIPATNRQPFFQRATKRTKKWTNYLRFVKEQLSM